ELPIQRTGFLETVQAAHATLAGRPPLADAGGPYWNTLGNVLVGAASPLNDPVQIPSVVEAFRSIGVRQIVLNRDRYQNPEGAQVRTLYTASPLGAIMRALLTRPAQTSIEIGLPPNRSRTLVLRQTGQNRSWNWPAHELTLFETDEKSQ